MEVEFQIKRRENFMTQNCKKNMKTSVGLKKGTMTVILEEGME